jgi:hypothetical protein
MKGRFHKLLADNSISLAHVCRLLADASQFLAYSSYLLAVPQFTGG